MMGFDFKATRSKCVLGLAIGTIALSGCSKAGISGAGSMRVEIDVYEGPVGQSPSVNMGQISALLDDTMRAVIDKMELAGRLQVRYCASNSLRAEFAANPRQVVGRNNRDCQILDQVIASGRVIAGNMCNFTRPKPWQVKEFEHRIPDELANLSADYLPTTYDLVDLCSAEQFGFDSDVSAKPQYWRDPQRLAQLSEQMRLTAMRLTESYVGYVPEKQEVRHSVQDFAYLLDNRAAELKNRSYILQKQVDECVEEEIAIWQLGNIRPTSDTVAARAENKGKTDSDLKRLFALAETKYISESRKERIRLLGYCSNSDVLASYAGNRARKYPTGDYLRGSKPSRFIEAFDWFNANLNATGTGAYLRRNRVRAVRALTEERHWERVNEVYHSGQGDVSAAFIKDELGNWSLKSYSNEPGRLLSAYTDVFDATIKAATDLARTAAGDPSNLVGATDALSLADRVATGKKSAAASIGALELSRFRQRTIARLEASRGSFEAEKNALQRPVLKDGKPKKDDDGNVIYEGRIEDLKKKLDEDKETLETLSREAQAENKKLDELNGTLRLCKEQYPDAQTKCASHEADVTKQQSAYDAKSRAASEAGDQFIRTRNSLAVAEATLKNLGDRAAEAADDILKDYQDDLRLMRETVMPQQVATDPKKDQAE